MDECTSTFKELIISRLGEEAYNSIITEIENRYSDEMSVQDFRTLFEEVIKKYENDSNIIDCILPFIPCNINQESKK